MFRMSETARKMRNANNNGPAGSGEARELTHGAKGVGEVLQHMISFDDLELPVGKGVRKRVEVVNNIRPRGRLMIHVHVSLFRKRS